MTDRKFLYSTGQRIKSLRGKKKMTQQQLALKCGFQKASLSRIESGKTNLSLLTLKRICQALKLDMAEIFR
jgi:transcriptional regulator with XRE-family HTH domain